MNYTKKRILLAGPFPNLAKETSLATSLFSYEVLHVKNAQEVKKALSSFAPDLLCTSLPLEGVHGISLIKILRNSHTWCNIGIFAVIQDPFPLGLVSPMKGQINKIFFTDVDWPQMLSAFDLFFRGSLGLDQLEPPKARPSPTKKAKATSSKNYLKLWGTRGSSPVSGIDYVQFGGNTSCCEIKYEDTHIILDAGTGIRCIPKPDTTAPEELHIFLTHLHWDHIIGLPFFKHLYRPECSIHIWVPQAIENPTQPLIEKIFSPTYFPVHMEEMAATFHFHEVAHQSEINLGPIKISTHYAYHPGETVCFKIHSPKATIVYAPDNELFLGYTSPQEGALFHDLCQIHQSMIQFFSGCSLLIHEAQYTTKEYEYHLGWGHSSIQNVAHFCKASSINNLLITHHDPSHTDQDLHKMLAMHQQCFQELEHFCNVTFAFDGMDLPL